MQLSMFEETCSPNIRWIEITKTPTITWVFDNASKAFNDLSILTEKDFIKTWQAVGIARYMFMRNIEPKGFVWHRHKHLIHQLGSEDLVRKVEVEFRKRELHNKLGLDISLKHD